MFASSKHQFVQDPNIHNLACTQGAAAVTIAKHNYQTTLYIHIKLIILRSIPKRSVQNNVHAPGFVSKSFLHAASLATLLGRTPLDQGFSAWLVLSLNRSTAHFCSPLGNLKQQFVGTFKSFISQGPSLQLQE